MSFARLAMAVVALCVQSLPVLLRPATGRDSHRPLPAVRHSVVLQPDIRGLEGNPAERVLTRAPLQLDLLKLASSRDIFGADLLNGISRQAQVFRRTSRQF